MRYLWLTLALSAVGWTQLSTMETSPYLVQSQGCATNGTNACSFPNNVQSGDVLVVVLWNHQNSSLPTLSDTLGTSFSVPASGSNTNACFGASSDEFFVGTAPSSGADTVTASFGGFQSGLMISEWKHVTITSDGASITHWSSTPSTITAPTITTNFSRDLIVSFSEACAHTVMSPLTGINLVMPASGAIAANSYEIAGASGSAYGLTFNQIGPSFGPAATGASGTLALKASAALAVSTIAIADPILTVPYSYQMQAVGGTGAYTWTTTAGSFPSGLSISSGGVISGTPTGGNLNPITFKVTDGSAATATAILTINVHNTQNSVVRVQGTAASGASCSSVTMPSSVAAGDLLLIAGIAPAGNGPATFRDTFGTVFAHIPVGGSVHEQSLTYDLGFAAASGTDSISCTGQSAFIATEYSNIQPYIDAGAFIGTVGHSASPIVSSNITAPVGGSLLTALADAYTSTSTLTVSAPFTADNSSTTGNTRHVTSYDTGAASGTQSVTYTMGSNTDGYWGILLEAFRPTGVGTPSTSVPSQAQVY